MLVATGCASTEPTADRPRGSDIAGLYTLPDATLTATDGTSAPLRADGQFSVVFFGYSQCPDVCTGIIADLASARRRLDPDVRDRVRFVVVTTDPARDTPEALGAYLDRFDPEIVGLTGDLDAIVAIGEQVGVDIAEGKRLPSGGYEVDHSTHVLVFGPDHGSRLVWTTGTAIGDIGHDLSYLVRNE